MIFNKDNLNFQLLDVLFIDDKNPTKSHIHKRAFCALSLRIDGDAIIRFKNKSVSLNKHDLAFFPANTPYTRIAKHDCMIVFHFNITNFISYDFEVIHNADFERLFPLFESALYAWQTKKTGYRYRASALLYEIFEAVHTESNPKLKNPVIVSIVDYIASNYPDSSLNVEKLAKTANMSVTWFRKLFWREVGISPKCYLSDYRLEHAKSLLNTGCYPVGIVAEKVGFTDSKNFAVAFKNHFGYPPSVQFKKGKY
ncbi:MAG: helix-turn-helix transcriptional regulator [Eubacteriales bacterium]|nr:helix-turn-helix transcriptional regulator [Eubacteriales bacterium]